MQTYYLLDTNTVSYVANGRSSSVRDRYASLPTSDLIISAITEGEIRFGLAKRQVGLRTRTLLEEFLATVTIAPWDSAVARTYGTLRAALTSTGETMSALDLLIAAHAITLKATLVTHDRAFHRLGPMLPVVDWATDL